MVKAFRVVMIDQNDSYYNKDIRKMVLIISELWQNVKLPFSISEVATIVSERKE